MATRATRSSSTRSSTPPSSRASRTRSTRRSGACRARTSRRTPRWTKCPYDFIRKRLSVVVERTTPATDTYRHTMITKGALRNVLEACVDAPDGSDPGGAGTVPIAEVRGALQERFEAYSEQGYRVLGVAVRDVHRRPDHQQGRRAADDVHRVPAARGPAEGGCARRHRGAQAARRGAQDHHRRQPSRRRQDGAPDGAGATDRAHRRGAAAA